MTYAFDPTQSDQSILGQIYRAQSLGHYNALYDPLGKRRFESFAKFPVWPGVRLANGLWTHAAGAPQFEPMTWAGIVEAIGLPDFSPASQDRGALWLLRTYGQESQWGSSFVDDGFVYGFAAQGST